VKEKLIYFGRYTHDPEICNSRKIKENQGIQGVLWSDIFFYQNFLFMLKFFFFAKYITF